MPKPRYHPSIAPQSVKCPVCDRLCVECTPYHDGELQDWRMKRDACYEDMPAERRWLYDGLILAYLNNTRLLEPGVNYA